MNPLKIFRKPLFCLFGAFLILTLSCSQYDNYEQVRSFDYSIKEYAISESYNLEKIFQRVTIQKSSTTSEISKILLDEINQHFQTSVVLPETAHGLINFDRAQILDISLSEGWINQEDIILNNMLFEDFKVYGFEVAIANYKDKILSMNLTDSEFERQNKFINIIEGIVDFDSSILDNINSSISPEKGGWACALFALAAATAALGSCATIAACGAAILLHIIALDGVGRKCQQYM